MAYIAILTLHLKREYWEQIRDGKKVCEYRRDKTYWRKRILKIDGSIRKFDLVHLIQGYPKSGDKSKLLIRKCGSINRQLTKHKEFGPHPVSVFRIDVSQKPIKTTPDRQAQAAAGDRQKHSGEPMETIMSKKKVAKKTTAQKPTKKAKDRQTTIPGVIPKVPKEVQDAVDSYVDRLRARQQLQTEESDLRTEAIERMQKHNIMAVDIDDGEKACNLEPGGDKLKIKKKESAVVAA